MSQAQKSMDFKNIKKIETETVLLTMESVVLYGAETFTLTTNLEKKNGWNLNKTVTHGLKHFMEKLHH